MKLVNKTAYKTEEIRKVLSLVHEHMAKTEGRLGGWGRGWGSKKHTTEVIIKYSRGGDGCSGVATLNGFDMVLRLHRPKPEERVQLGTRGDHHTGPCTYRDFIWLAYHEMMHLYGYNHRQFKNIGDSEIQEILSPTGHTLFDELPTTLTEERTMDVKLSGTSYAALDLTGVPVEATREIKRGKGIVVVVTTSPEGAAHILNRLQGRDKEDSGLTYEQRYACRVDARRLDKQLNQVEEIAPAAAAVEAPAPTEETPAPEA